MPTEAGVVWAVTFSAQPASTANAMGMRARAPGRFHDMFFSPCTELDFS
jgi:hypothetical protein